MHLTELECPNCGAGLSPPAQGTTARCDFCGHVFALTQDPKPSPPPELSRAPPPEPASSGGVAVTIRVVRGGQLVGEERFTRDVIWIGGEPGSTLHLGDDPAVGRKHAVIEVFAGVVTLIDLRSTAGTLVNGVPINKAELHTGDKITLGSTELQVTLSLLRFPVTSGVRSLLGSRGERGKEKGSMTQLELATLARGMSKAAFIRRVGPFILFQPPPGQALQLQGRTDNISKDAIDRLMKGGASPTSIAGMVVTTIPNPEAESGTLTVGRVADNDLLLTDASVSSHHGKITWSPSGPCEVHDLGSRNGTFVNSGFVAPYTSRPLADRDVVAFGGTQLVFYGTAKLHDVLAGTRPRT